MLGCKEIRLKAVVTHVQGPVALGLKAENRLKLHKKAKLVSTLGRMTCKTRMGRENATAGQAELKLRLGDDQRSQVGVPALALSFCDAFEGLP